MGIIQHHTIIVTGIDYQETPVKDNHNLAKNIFSQVSEIMESDWNGYTTFVIPPDGSKEGWAPSDDGDIKRKEFLSKCNRNGCDVIEISYGELGNEIY
jgi:hypothetical protein